MVSVAPRAPSTCISRDQILFETNHPVCPGGDLMDCTQEFCVDVSITFDSFAAFKLSEIQMNTIKMRTIHNRAAPKLFY